MSFPSHPPLRAALLLVVIACHACAAAAAPRDPAGRAGGLALREVARGLESPVWLTAPAGDPRLFIVEQPGRIRIVRDGRLLARPFLDLTDRVRSGGERGLLSVAFHPDYARNGRFFVDYTDRRGDTRIERYQVTRDPDVADPASGKLLLHIQQPYANHNGGLVLFGPDGLLYIGMGDGGSAGDPHGNGQSTTTLLGKLLRIDVDRGDTYAIPPDNPFADGRGGRPEIWALGLRNPWRFCFDGPTGTLLIADVGQDRWEEVDAIPAGRAGANFGWRLFEGRHPFDATGRGAAGLVPPVVEYGHAEGCSVIGGFVYRGRDVPALSGHYLYGDYCGGWVRSFRWDGRAASEPRRWDLPAVRVLTSFGRDARGEVYVLSQEGRVFRILRAS